MTKIKNLYEQYQNDVYGYLISITHDKTLSEDLTSETFLAAIKSIASFKGDSSIKTWLFSIARYKWYEYLRKQKIELTSDTLIENYAINNLSIEQSIINKELVDKIQKLIEMENERNKDIVLMRLDGYSFYEISVKHAISESSARVIDFRVRSKLRNILEKEGYYYD